MMFHVKHGHSLMLMRILTTCGTQWLPIIAAQKTRGSADPSLADAEVAENDVEEVFHVDATSDAAQGA